MVKCWNCEHLIIAYSGAPASERLFEKELRKCTVSGVVFERRSDITEEHECEDYREAKNTIKYEQKSKLLESRCSCRHAGFRLLPYPFHHRHRI